MNFSADTWWVVLIIVGAVTTSLTYLIKIAIFARLDKTEKTLNEVLNSSISKDEHEKDVGDVKNDIEIIKTNYTTKSQHAKDFDECRFDIKKIKEDYVPKDDFLRELSKMDRKIDKVLDILLRKEN